VTPPLVQQRARAFEDSESGDNDPGDFRIGELLVTGLNLVQADLG